MSLYEMNLNKRYRESVLHEQYLAGQSVEIKEHLRGLKKEVVRLIKHFSVQKFHLKSNNARHLQDDINYLKTTIEELKIRKINIREQLILNMDTIQKFLIRLQLQQAAIMFQLQRILARKRRSG